MTELSLRIFSFLWCKDHISLDLFSVSVNDWEGSLLYLQRESGHWKFDLFFLRDLVLRVRS